MVVLFGSVLYLRELFERFEKRKSHVLVKMYYVGKLVVMYNITTYVYYLYLHTRFGNKIRK